MCTRRGEYTELNKLCLNFLCHLKGYLGINDLSSFKICGDVLQKSCSENCFPKFCEFFCTFINKQMPTQVFFCKLGEMFQRTFFVEHRQETTSVVLHLTLF